MLLALILAASPVHDDSVRFHLFAGPSAGVVLSYSGAPTAGVALDLGVQCNDWFAVAAFSRVEFAIFPTNANFLPHVGLFAEFSPARWVTLGPGVGTTFSGVTFPIMLAFNIPGPASEPRRPCWRIAFDAGLGLSPYRSYAGDAALRVSMLLANVSLGVALM
jgi:hypothetical protein